MIFCCVFYALIVRCVLSSVDRLYLLLFDLYFRYSLLTPEQPLPACWCLLYCNNNFLILQCLYLCRIVVCPINSWLKRVEPCWDAFLRDNVLYVAHIVNTDRNSISCFSTTRHNCPLSTSDFSEAEFRFNSGLVKRAIFVLLVGEDSDWNASHLLILKKLVEFLLAVFQPCLVTGINNPYQAI